MADTQIALYHGTNDAQEFWESEDHSLLILRPLRQCTWSVHQKYCFKGCAESAEAAAKQFHCQLSREREWVRTVGIFQFVSV
jgi:hypothetical protein